jgi:hypothetical protein
MFICIPCCPAEPLAETYSINVTAVYYAMGWPKPFRRPCVTACFTASSTGLDNGILAAYIRRYTQTPSISGVLHWYAMG